MGEPLARSGGRRKHGTMFQLAPRLKDDTLPVTDLALSRVLLMNDNRYPWLILVPAKPDLRELHELDEAGRRQLMDEVCRASQALDRLYSPDKINVGAPSCLTS